MFTYMKHQQVSTKSDTVFVFTFLNSTVDTTVLSMHEK